MKETPIAKFLLMKWRADWPVRDRFMEFALVFGLSAFTSSYIVVLAYFENSYISLLQLWLVLGGRAASKSQRSVRHFCYEWSSGILWVLAGASLATADMTIAWIVSYF